MLRFTTVQLVVAGQVIEQHVEQEAVELRFRQRIRALELDRVLRREHEERPLDRVVMTAHRDREFLHRLEQRGLRLRRRAVDLVREQHVREQRARHERPACAGPVVMSSSMMSVPVTSVGIRSGVNWMRLNVSPSAIASVRTSSVFAVPGMPVIRQ